MKQTIDIGNSVVCDLCNEDFTDSSETGGLMFQSKGVCPHCTPRFLETVNKYHEEHFIRDEARENETFRDFILRHREGDNTITIITED
jgi:hypothetical protein